MRRFLTGTALAAALLLATPAAPADDASPVSLAALSGELYQLGLERRDALLMLTAARLRKGVDWKPSELVAEGGTAGEADWLDWEAMLEAAIEMAGDDILLTDLAEDIRLTAAKGQISRPQRAAGHVGPGETAVYRKVAFTGGDFAEIYVEGSGDANIDLYIHDQQGNLICSDRDASDRAHCGWLPETTAPFDISIVNRGDKVNRYSLITN